MISRTLLDLDVLSAAISSGVGSRPPRCSRWLCSDQLVLRLDDVYRQADGAALLEQGAGDGLAIHQWARVENGSRGGSRFSTARMRPRLPSWIRSSSGRPRLS